MRACEHTLKLTAALSFVIALSAPATVRGGTDANGFVDEWLAAINYTSPGCGGGGAAGRAQDYLCDGAVSEDTIEPFDGLELGPPVADPEDCLGSDEPALQNFHPNALLDPTFTVLPITAQLTTNTNLDFDAISGGADNTMAYAWVWVENTTDQPINATAGIGSDDSINVEVNRVTVFDLEACRGSGAAGSIQNRFPVTFLPGGNLVQVKVWDGCCGWNFRMRFEDENCAPILSGEGPLIIGIDPIEVPEPFSARTIDATGTAPDPVTASITINVANDGAAYSLEELFDEGWTASNMSPPATESGPGFIRWDNITAATASYDLARSDLWVTSQGAVDGEITLSGVTQSVTGATQIPGGISPFVSEVLVTASMNIADDPVTLDPIQGCNVPPEMISGEWISDGEGLTDANIVPEEGLRITPDFLGESQAGGYDILGINAELVFFPEGFDDTLPMELQAVSSDATGLYDWQRADIYEADVNDTMNVAFFYAVNDTGADRRVVIGFGSDDSGGFRVNGMPAWANMACRGDPGFADKVIVTLRPGKNLISVYTFENGGGYNMRIRFEDEDFNPIPIETTVDPAGYSFDPTFDPEPQPLFNFVPEVIVTPSYDMANFQGCNVTQDAIRGDWITGVDGDGNEISDATIVPFEGMVFQPDFLGAAPNTAGHSAGLSAAAQDRFWTAPGDAAGTEGIIARASVSNVTGLYNWQAGPIYDADIDQTMNVAWFYVENPTGEAQCLNMAFGSDDSGGVRVNGRPVLATAACRGDPGFADKFFAQFDPGKNLVSVYTFENGGGYNMRIRFEDENFQPLVIGRDVFTTLDPAGYDPAAHPEPDPSCQPVEPEPEPYIREGPALGLVTQYLVNAVPFSQGLGTTPPAGAFPEDYITDADGNPPGLGTIQEGAIVQPGSTGLITDGFLPGRGADACGFTTLVEFDGFIDGDGVADPSDFDGELFYGGGPNNYSASLFFYINNITNDDLEAWFGFASDDGASLFVNGQLIAEHLGGRGRGGNNVLQTSATMPALLEPGPNLVQLSYLEAGGGSGARIGFYTTGCFDEVFSEDQVEVSANPPDFTPSAVTVTRSTDGFDCDGNGTVTLTVSVEGGGSADLDLSEELPAGVTGSNPSAGTFNAGGTELTFNGQASDGMEITYEISGGAEGLGYCASTANGAPVVGDTALGPSTDVCADLDVLEEIGYFINTGSTEFIDALGRVWQEDSLANPSKHLVSPNVHTANFDPGPLAVIDTSFDDLAVEREYPPEVFPSERWDDADIIYEFTALPAGSYEVVLLFLEGCCSDGCEDIEDPQQSAGGCRVFDILLNGEIVADQFSQNVQAARQAGVLPGVGANFIGITQQFCAAVGNDGLLSITIDDLGGGNPPQNASIKGIAIRKVSGAEAEDLGCPDDQPTEGFIRGDIDSSGGLNITDAIVFLGWQFLGDPPPPCLDAADVDDSGSHNITDAIFLLQFQFLGTAPPPDPGPVPGEQLSPANCGVDPTDDDPFDCAETPPLCQG